MKIRLLPVVALTLAAIVACGGGETTTQTPPPAPEPPKEQPKPAEPAAGAGDIGVAECDEYIKKMSECLGKMDATVKATYEQTFAQTKDAWKQAAATPEGKAGLQAGCKAALDAMASMPCGTGAAGAPAAAETKPADAGTAKKEEPKKEEAKKEEPKKEETKTEQKVEPPKGQGKGHNR